MQLENDIEKRLIKKVKELGGLSFKFTSPSTKGVPDRIVIFNGRTHFIELKRPTGTPRALQLYWISEIKNQGVDALTLSTFEEVDEFVEELRLGR
ncbi:VRR-NUC domain-containing protein [Lactococcus lactis]|uniref:VRR-NUC domain-containing protein n=1 Tax=Lactococcus lactis TaxID=1358 RepID=A0AAP3Z103_9LACT|nr:VRR-NUC domain-containing protein [Lactococcus lactis]MDG4968266.1 VRR-NUC domain-containing protein [Lactococcus lactis]MDG4976374.1 VRR-NUC domain-containing protein [Lactococcus lactis]MDG5102178.1 VRR-NUC domain-containing protein [Lactococcus lactis]